NVCNSVAHAAYQPTYTFVQISWKAGTGNGIAQLRDHSARFNQQSVNGLSQPGGLAYCLRQIGNGIRDGSNDGIELLAYIAKRLSGFQRQQFVNGVSGIAQGCFQRA